MKQLKSTDAVGAVVNILAELDDHYVVRYADDRKGALDPFIVAKSSALWEPYDMSMETPRTGDLVAGGTHSANARYRVLGTTETQMIIVAAEKYMNGGWAELPAGDIQEDVVLPKGTIIFIRALPDLYLKVVERP